MSAQTTSAETVSEDTTTNKSTSESVAYAMVAYAVVAYTVVANGSMVAVPGFGDVAGLMVVTDLVGRLHVGLLHGDGLLGGDDHRGGLRVACYSVAPMVAPVNRGERATLLLGLGLPSRYGGYQA